MWRMDSNKARSYDFTLLDMNKGAGWDLAKLLLSKRSALLRYLLLQY